MRMTFRNIGGLAHRAPHARKKGLKLEVVER